MAHIPEITGGIDSPEDLNAETQQGVESPVNINSEPVGDVGSPGDINSEPVVDVDAPENIPSKPVVDVDAPVNLSSEPVGDINAPDDISSEPVEPINTPSSIPSQPKNPVLRALTPLLSLDFASETYAQGLTPKNLLDIVTYSRASAATFTNRQKNNIGQWEYFIDTAQNGELRLEYDPETGEALGAKLEGSSTNQALWSDDFTQPSWSKEGGVTVNGAFLSPDNTLTAQKITKVADVGFQGVRLISSPVNAGEYEAVSIYAKAGTITVFSITHNDIDGGTPASKFDLSAGVVVSTGVGLIAEIENIGGGWFRCSSTGMKSAGGGQLKVCDIRDDSVLAGAYIFIWGAQVETIPFTSSYIKTEGVTVTRAADLMSVSGSNLPVGTGAITATANYNYVGSAANYWVLSGENGTGGGTISLRTTGVGGSWYTSTTAGTGSNAVARDLDRGKVTFTNNAGSPDYTSYNTGGNSLTRTTQPTNAGDWDGTGNIFIGKWAGGSQHAFGNFSKIEIYNQALTAEEVKKL